MGRHNVSAHYNCRRSDLFLAWKLENGWPNKIQKYFLGKFYIILVKRAGLFFGEVPNKPRKESRTIQQIYSRSK